MGFIQSIKFHWLILKPPGIGVVGIDLLPLINMEMTLSQRPEVRGQILLVPVPFSAGHIPGPMAILQAFRIEHQVITTIHPSSFQMLIWPKYSMKHDWPI